MQGRLDAAVVLAFLLPFSLSGRGGEPVVAIQASEERIAYGNAISLDVRIRAEPGTPLAVYPLGYLAKRKVTMEKEGRITPFLWTGIPREEGDPRITLQNGTVVYRLSGIFLLPGRYTFTAEADGQDGKFVSAPAAVTVEEPETGLRVETFGRFVAQALAEAPHEHAGFITRQMHAVLMTMDGDASVFTRDLLWNNRRTRGGPVAFLKDEAVQVLGKLMSRKLAVERKRPRGTLKAADILRLLAEERSFSAIGHYFMIMHYLEDLMTDGDQRTLEALVNQYKAHTSAEAAFGAFMAGAGNGRYRAKYADAIPDEVKNHPWMDESAKGTVIGYLNQMINKDGEK